MCLGVPVLVRCTKIVLGLNNYGTFFPEVKHFFHIIHDNKRKRSQKAAGCFHTISNDCNANWVSVSHISVKRDDPKLYGLWTICCSSWSVKCKILMQWSQANRKVNDPSKCVSIWSQIIAECFQAICDPRTAIECDHMETMILLPWSF